MYSVRLQVAFMQHRVNGQFIMEGLASSFLFVMGGMGFVLLDQTNKPTTPKLNRILLLSVAFVCISVSFLMCRVFMRMKLPYVSLRCVLMFHAIRFPMSAVCFVSDRQQSIDFCWNAILHSLSTTAHIKSLNVLKIWFRCRSTLGCSWISLNIIEYSRNWPYVSRLFIFRQSTAHRLSLTCHFIQIAHRLNTQLI